MFVWLPTTVLQPDEQVHLNDNFKLGDISIVLIRLPTSRDSLCNNTSESVDPQSHCKRPTKRSRCVCLKVSKLVNLLCIVRPNRTSTFQKYLIKFNIIRRKINQTTSLLYPFILLCFNSKKTITQRITFPLC